LIRKRREGRNKLRKGEVRDEKWCSLFLSGGDGGMNVLCATEVNVVCGHGVPCYENTATVLFVSKDVRKPGAFT
jgi:hypothetical protein